MLQLNRKTLNILNLLLIATFIFTFSCSKNNTNGKVQYIEEQQGDSTTSTESNNDTQENVKENIKEEEQKEDTSEDITDQLQSILDQNLVGDNKIENPQEPNDNKDTDQKNDNKDLSPSLNKGEVLVVEQHPVDKNGKIIDLTDNSDNIEGNIAKSTSLHIVPALKINEKDFIMEPVSVETQESIQIEGQMGEQESIPGQTTIIKTEDEKKMSNNCWEAAKCFIKHKDGTKTLKDKKAAYKQKVYISLSANHLVDHEFKYHEDHKHEDLFLEEVDLKIEDKSIITDNCKQVKLKINTYEAEKNKRCKIEKDQKCPCKVDKRYCGMGSKWCKDKIWRQLNIHIHPNDLETVMKEEISIDGKDNCTIEEWVRKLKEDMPDKRFGKYQKDDKRNKMKDELSMKILEKLLNKSELYIKLKKKACDKDETETIYEGKSKICAKLINESNDENCPKWRLVMKTGPLKHKTKLIV